jgi:translation initiation factor IF-2
LVLPGFIGMVLSRYHHVPAQPTRRGRTPRAEPVPEGWPVSSATVTPPVQPVTGGGKPPCQVRHDHRNEPCQPAIRPARQPRHAHRRTRVVPTQPRSGTTRNGSAYARPTPGPAIAATACSPSPGSPPPAPGLAGQPAACQLWPSPSGGGKPGAPGGAGAGRDGCTPRARPAGMMRFAAPRHPAAIPAPHGAASPR